MFAGKIWWTKGQLDGGVWHWADNDNTWFVFDPDSYETESTTAVSLQTDNWMNAKDDKSNKLHKICEMSKFKYMFQESIENNNHKLSVIQQFLFLFFILFFLLKHIYPG